MITRGVGLAKTVESCGIGAHKHGIDQIAVGRLVFCSGCLSAAEYKRAGHPRNIRPMFFSNSGFDAELLALKVQPVGVTR